MDLIVGKYESWESVWGITSKYWRRNQGADHISVMAEPLHGFWHPRSRRGNFHFVFSQYQLKPHIVISVELSTKFVEMYPKCAAKNIVVPYPNPNGKVFNGGVDQQVRDLITDETTDKNKTTNNNNNNDEALFHEEFLQKSKVSTSIYPAEKSLGEKGKARPIGQYYSAGTHGECRKLRISMKKDYQCTNSSKMFGFLGSERNNNKNIPYSVGMKMSTFCPCPGGDSPSAKRMYDATINGCIPVILSKDFVWAMSTDYDKDMIDPSSFSLRLNAANFTERLTTENTCEIIQQQEKSESQTQVPLDQYLQNIPSDEIQRLRQGLEKAKHHYSFWSFSSEHPDKLLYNNILPDGGASHALIKALEARVDGKKWTECEEELKDKPEPNFMKNQPKKFEC